MNTRDCLNMAALVTSDAPLKQIVNSILDRLAKDLDFSGKLLYLRDDRANAYVAFPFRGGRKRVLAPETSRGLAAVVRDTGEAVIAPKASDHPDYFTRVDLPTKGRHWAIGCWPLKMGGDIIGMIELRSHAFTRKEIDRVNSFLYFLTLACSNTIDKNRIEDLTITDDLTGLFNARHLTRIVEMEIRRAERYQGVFSIIFVDLDNFKKVNDSHGHLVGSRVLVEISALLSNSLRLDVDMAFRYGGDEFVVFLPNTGREGGLAVAERLRYLVRSRVFRNDEGEPFTVTASFGLASFPEDAHSRMDIIRLADDLMYRAKAAGRDSISVSSELPAKKAIKKQ